MGESKHQAAYVMAILSWSEAFQSRIVPYDGALATWLKLRQGGPTSDRFASGEARVCWAKKHVRPIPDEYDMTQNLPG